MCDIETDYNDQMIFFMEKITLQCSNCSFSEDIEWSFHYYCIKVGYLPEVPLLCPTCVKEKVNHERASK